MPNIFLDQLFDPQKNWSFFVLPKKISPQNFKPEFSFCYHFFGINYFFFESCCIRKVRFEITPKTPKQSSIDMYSYLCSIANSFGRETRGKSMILLHRGSTNLRQDQGLQTTFRGKNYDFLYQRHLCACRGPVECLHSGYNMSGVCRWHNSCIWWHFGWK